MPSTFLKPLSLAWRGLRFAARWWPVGLVAIVLFLANVPGEVVEEWEFFDSWRMHHYYEHGWPLTYLSRDSWDPARIRTTSCWDVRRGVIWFSPIRLAADGMIVWLLLLATRTAQLCIGDRWSPRFSLRAMLAGVAAASLLMAFAAKWRHNHQEMADQLRLRPPSSVFGRSGFFTDDLGAGFGNGYGEVDCPRWLAEFLPGPPPDWMCALGENDLACAYPGGRLYGPTIARAMQLRPDSVVLELVDWAPDLAWREFAPYVADCRHVRLVGFREQARIDPRALFACFPKLRWLSIETNLEVREWKDIIAVAPPELEVLELAGAPITDEDMAALARFTELRALVVRRYSKRYSRRLEPTENAITTAGITRLKSLSRLQDLALIGDAIRLDRATSFAGFDRLRYLSLRGVQIEGWSTTDLQQLPCLIGVDLRDTLVNPIEFASAISLPRLRYLNVMDCPLDDHLVKPSAQRYPDVDVSH
jgi:hypothetical protein